MEHYHTSIPVTGEAVQTWFIYQTAIAVNAQTTVAQLKYHLAMHVTGEVIQYSPYRISIQATGSVAMSYHSYIEVAGKTVTTLKIVKIEQKTEAYSTRITVKRETIQTNKYHTQIAVASESTLLDRIKELGKK